MSSEMEMRVAADGDVCILIPPTGMDAGKMTELSIRDDVVVLSQDGTPRYEAELDDESRGALMSAGMVEVVETDDHGFRRHERVARTWT